MKSRTGSGLLLLPLNSGERACINTLPSPTACVCLVGYGRGSVSSVSERKGKHDRTCSGVRGALVGRRNFIKGPPTGRQDSKAFHGSNSAVRVVSHVSHTHLLTHHFFSVCRVVFSTHTHTLCVSNPFRSVVVCKSYIHTLSSHTRSLK